MAIQVTEKMQKQINELVASGRYADETAAAEAAFDMLVSEERKLVTLKAELAIAQEHIDRGELVDFTRERAEFLMNQAKADHKAGKPISDAVTP